MASDPAAPHAYVRHHDRKPGCAVCGNLRKDPIHNGPFDQGEPSVDDRVAVPYFPYAVPRQLAHVTLRELTPELRAHYACDPALECGHPDCQP